MVRGAAKALVWVLLFVSATCVAAPGLLLLEKYRPGMDISGWYMSEKLDGVRTYWNGEELLSRQGNAFAAPPWFLADFPPFELDGELWRGKRFLIGSGLSDEDRKHPPPIGAVISFRPRTESESTCFTQRVMPVSRTFP